MFSNTFPVSIERSYVSSLSFNMHLLQISRVLSGSPLLTNALKILAASWLQILKWAFQNTENTIQTSYLGLSGLCGLVSLFLQFYDYCLPIL